MPVGRQVNMLLLAAHIVSPAEQVPTHCAVLPVIVMQVAFPHVTAAPNVPSGMQVCTPVAVPVAQVVVPGVQDPTQAPLTHALSVHVTVPWHVDCVPSGWQVICPGLQSMPVGVPPLGVVVQLSGWPG
jgi:hypothetical protein